jgi:murein DD-endopeptidase MepM/ murein hydrolase activator NlpD
MKSSPHHKRSTRAASKRGVALLAAAVSIVMAIAAGTASAQVAPPTETAPPPPTGQPHPPGTALFPIQGAHTYNQGFGGKRGHQGVDLFSACGTPLVAVGYNRVIFRGFHARAGHYLVLRYKRFKQDYMYAHLSGPPLVAKKAKVTPGQLIGYVGATGNASGCHLHFELWVGKWYRGGYPVDPVPSLQAWDAYS